MPALGDLVLHYSGNIVIGALRADNPSDTVDLMGMVIKPIADRASRQQVVAKLRSAGLRPTQQRLSLGELLLDGRDRHITAEGLHEEALAASIPVSLATVYNTLHQFTQAGLLREVCIDGAKTYFDTNVTNHHHFFSEDNRSLMDISGDQIALDGLPVPPEGMEIVRVDVIIRVRKKR